MSDFLKIGFTAPGFVDNECEKICRFLKDGYLDLIHIRKPEASAAQMRELISGIDVSLHPKLRIHSCFQLTEEFDLAGVHLNSRSPQPPSQCNSVTKSCHSIEELLDVERYDYVTLSPIFDSISKKGYKAAFTFDTLRKAIYGRRVVALGGVTPDRFPILREVGFIGAAMLGHLWD